MSKVDSFYKENFLDKSEELSFLPSLKEEEKSITVANNDLSAEDLEHLGFRDTRNKSAVYYISDIHLDHKIYNKFGKAASFKKVRDYIHKIARKLLLDDHGNEIHCPSKTILINGDTSHSIEINKIFFRTLSQLLGYYNDVYVILGNHELWEFNTAEEAIAAYQEFFDTLPNIHLLHNAVLVDEPYTEHYKEYLAQLKKIKYPIDNKKRISSKERMEKLEKYWARRRKVEEKYYGKTREEQWKNIVKERIISQDMLTKLSVEEIRALCLDSRKIVFGTIGYAALNPIHNVYTGIYRGAVTTKEYEDRLSKEASDIYTKLTLAVPKHHVIVSSHMALTDWTKTPPVPNWLYFSGHTHRNKRTISDELIEYADNQVGYNGKRIKFNVVVRDNLCDIFAYYEDGIHRITEDDYMKFYSCFSKVVKGVDRRWCEESDIIMIKNNGVYLFLEEKDTKDKLYLLEGGKKRLLNNNDLQYYYDNMSKINVFLKNAVAGIRQYLEALSLYIKNLGGSGFIHGNIVDVDMLNHVMVDIETGQLKPYFAWSIDMRFEYSDLPKLLEVRRPDMYRKFLDDKANLPVVQDSALVKKDVKFSSDTSIYRNSNMMLKIQDMIDYNVIRFWSDDLVDAINNREKPKLLNDKNVTLL